MASNLRGYSADEVLNKVLNTSNDSIQVDIVAGAEYAEDSGHTSTDTGNFILGVRNDTLAALGGTDGDYVPFQMNADGALYVEISSGGANDSIYVDDADWTDSTSKHTLVGGLYQSSPQTITDGDVGPFQVDADGALHISDGGNAITVDGTVTANLSATDNAVLDTIDAVLDTIKTDTGTIDSDTDAIKTATESSNTHLGNMFYDTALSVTPSDGSDLTGEPFYAVYVGTGGDLKVDMSDGGSAVTLSNVASGQLLPIMVERIYSTGTTASNIIAFK
jgi:hypothetical protein